jgi:Dyp-type peroxidase family protein
VDREDIQGIVLHGYRRERFARYHLLTFGAGQPRQVLTRLVTDVSSADEPRSEIRRNLALTASGLRGLGLGDPEMAQFTREFRQGMAHPERSLALGDAADESPEHWDFGGPNTPPIDGLWMTFAESKAQLDEASGRHERLFARFGLTAYVQDAQLGPELRDHLGYEMKPPQDASLASRRRVKRAPMGEFVLGERDAVGERARGPLVPIKFSQRPLPDWVRAKNALNFGKNGSYLVLRKLQLNTLAGRRDDLALAEHMRRARGPLGALENRLIRRSRPYGDTGDEARGLLFVALNADIRAQFELVQQSYFNAPLAGAASEVDPFVGRVPGRPSERRLARLRGGGYFFLPGLRALNYLAESGG